MTLNKITSSRRSVTSKFSYITPFYSPFSNHFLTYRFSLEMQDKSGYVTRRKKGVIVVPRPALAFLVNNEDACYSILALYHPWRKEGEWIVEYGSSCAAIRMLQVAKPQVQKYIERVLTMVAVEDEARQRHDQSQGRERGDTPEDDAELSDDLSDDEGRGGASFPPLDVAQLEAIAAGGAGWQSLTSYTTADIARAKSFIETEALAEKEQRSAELDRFREIQANNSEMTGPRPWSAELLEMYDQLDEKQLLAFKLVERHVSSGTQLQLIITGNVTFSLFFSFLFFFFFSLLLFFFSLSFLSF